MRALRGSSLEWTSRTEEVPLRELIAVPVDVGKSTAMVMACDFTGRVLLAAVEFPLTREGVAQMLGRVRAAVPAGAQLVRVGVEAAGHYHLPMIAAGVWPDGWQVVELNPAHVSAQRRVNGQRGVKTDQVDLVAIARRWGSPAKVYRAAGLTPALYASAGRRRDGAISREGSVHLRRALIGLGMGLWQNDPAARTYATALRERGKPGGIIACALAHRADKIAFAMVRDQAPYDPARWS